MSDIITRGSSYPNPLILSPSMCQPLLDTHDWQISPDLLQNRVGVGAYSYYAPVTLPQGAVVREVTLYAYRDNVGAVFQSNMRRADFVGGLTVMCSLIPDWITGDDNMSVDVIAVSTIDNNNYSYSNQIHLNPNVAANEIRFRALKIRWD